MSTGAAGTLPLCLVCCVSVIVWKFDKTLIIISKKRNLKYEIIQTLTPDCGRTRQDMVLMREPTYSSHVLIQCINKQTLHYQTLLWVLWGPGVQQYILLYWPNGQLVPAR